MTTDDGRPQTAVRTMTWLGRWFRLVREILDDVLVLAGCGLVVYGTYLVSPVATWFVAGGMLIILGVLVGIGRSKQL